MMFAAGRGRCRAASVLLGLAVALFGATAALASGGAYTVEDSEVDAPGSCKIETSASFASNRDFIASFTPTCSVNLGRPVELAVPFQRVREGGGWSSTIGFQAKTNFISVEKGPVGVGLMGGAFIDPANGRLASSFVTVPVSFQLAEPFRVDVNAGWAWESGPSRHLFAWGIGYEWQIAKPVKWIGEVFGFAGSGNNGPRAQTGLRFTPVSSFDIDVIYGRNILGTRANWVTLGLNVRF